MTTYKILSLDGGGIRGLLTTVLLERLEQARPGFLDRFSLFAGTSIGSILALSLASGLTPADIRQLFEKHGREIFADSPIAQVRNLGFTRGAKYSNKNLKRELTARFQAKTLADLSKRVLVASFDLDNEGQTPGKPRMWKPKSFHNFPGEGSDGDQNVVDVALRSSAAPLYFPTYQGYVDGFIVANNPSMCALSQALSTKSAPLSRITLLSLGTGLNSRYFPQQNANWGWRQWLFQLQPRQRQLYVMPLVYMMWEGSVDTANYQCRQLIGSRFHRLDPVLTTPVDIDDVKRMPQLVAIAEAADLTDTLAWLDQHVLASVAAPPAPHPHISSISNSSGAG